MLVLVLAGCLAAPEPRADAPVLSPDGALEVAVERWRCRCNGDDPGHAEGLVRARAARGRERGRTIWVSALDGDPSDALDPATARMPEPPRVSIEGRPGEEVVVVAPRGGPARRFRLRDGERLD